MIARSCATALLTAFLLFGAQPAGVQPNPNAVVAGDLIVEPPTLISLGFEWKIQGDDNRNAQVDVSYRKQGETQWKPGDAGSRPLTCLEMSCGQRNQLRHLV